MCFFFIRFYQQGKNKIDMLYCSSIEIVKNVYNQESQPTILSEIAPFPCPEAFIHEDALILYIKIALVYVGIYKTGLHPYHSHAELRAKLILTYIY